MAQRSDLQTLLETILGSSNVYFQQPPSNQMEYPAIVYRRDDIDAKFADNSPYRLTRRYLVTLIGRNPDNDSVLDQLARLPLCTFNRFFAAENLNHDVFILYF